MKEYVIMYNGYYIAEGTDEGVFHEVKKLAEATWFGTLYNATSYIEHDMKMNPHNVSIHEIETTVKETPLILDYEDNYVPSSTVFSCNVCDKYYPRYQLNKYRPDLDSEVEELCDKCYEEIDSKYSNII